MSDNKVFYVNYELGKVASDAETVCDIIECKQCPYYDVRNCEDKRYSNPQKFLEECGFVPVPFDMLSGKQEKHYVVFPQANIPTAFEVDKIQFTMLEKLRDMDICDFNEIEIKNL